MGRQPYPDCRVHAGLGFYRYHFTLNRDLIQVPRNPVRGFFCPYIGPNRIRPSMTAITAPRPVLGIETSCDETGVALLRWEPQAPGHGLLAHALYTQIKLHADYGGVVPELASRDHVRKLLPLVREALAQAGLTPADLGGVAYTAGPGLVGALLVGAATGRAMAWALGVPAIGVHHMEGHLLAPVAGRRSARAALRRAAGVGWSFDAGGSAGYRRSTGSWATPWTMRPAKPSTRPPS